jgi:hypothetical protein
MGGSGWMKIEFARGGVGRIQKQFLAAFTAHGLPLGAALFSDPQFSWPQTTIFISPKAAEAANFLVATYGAVPCDVPPEALFLLGHDDDRTMVPLPKD